jgi:hypothetical protein
MTKAQVFLSNDVSEGQENFGLKKISIVQLAFKSRRLGGRAHFEDRYAVNSSALKK